MTADSFSGPVSLAPVSLVEADGRSTVVFERDFGHPQARVWEVLTRRDELLLWAPHTVDHDITSVGKVVFTMLGDVAQGDEAVPDIDVPGAVLVCDAPNLLEHSWVNDALAWHLKPSAAGTRLTLRHTLSDASMASAVAAGWHLCLDVADAVLSGHPTPPVRGMEAMKHGWNNLNSRYASEFGVAPSVIELSPAD
jgi:uncharacterized protein YndB with AHSA1/START domain